MSIADVEEDLALALTAVRRSCDELRTYDRATVRTEYKSPDQIVSEADLVVDRRLRRELCGPRPSYGWRSEESEDRPARTESHPRWIVDPIDATHAFLDGDADYTICVGQVRDGRPVLGVVMNPFRGELYYATRGAGAFRIEAGADPRRLPRQGDAPRPVSRVLVSSTEVGEFRRWADWEVRIEAGTAWKMVLVAAGAADAFCTTGSRFEWDVCAPAVICLEAGCRVTDAGDRILRYGRPDPVVEGLIVARLASHPRAVARLQSN